MAGRERIARAVNAYVARRLEPLVRDVAESRAATAALSEEVRALRTMNDALLSTVNALSRRRSSEAPIRCLFLVHYMEAWDSIADVYELMRLTDDFQPIVASIPRRLVAARDFADEDLTHTRLEALGVPHLRFNSPDSFRDLEVIKQLDPHLIFRQSQWDADIPPAYGPEHLGFARLALIPYETMSLIEAAPPPPGINDWLTDSRYHRNCWAVFCSNEYVRELAQSRSPSTNGDHFVVTGHPKADRIRRALGPPPTQPRPFTVVWSAHHSLNDDWSRFGMFHLIHGQMIEWAASRPDWRFIFSPHPSLTSLMDGGGHPLSPAVAADFRARWAELPNTETFTGDAGGGYAHLFATSDVFLSDGISMLLEYQITNKPVVFLERPDHRPFSPMGEIARTGFHSVSEVPEAQALVERFAAGEADPLAEAQRSVVADLFGDHKPAHEIVEHIRLHW